MTLRLKELLSASLRWLLGALFVFSGAVKCVDPVGTSIYVEKYLATYGLDFMLSTSQVLGVVLAIVEFVLGVLLVVGILRRYASLTAFILLSIFTLITLLSATLFPIGDCGCFGSVVMLGPWQTLIKNLIFLPIAWYVWYSSREKQMTTRWHIVVLTIAVLLPLGVSYYASAHMPLVDVSPYREGIDLRSAVNDEREKIEANTRSKLLFRDVATGDIVESDEWLDEGYEFIDAVVYVADVDATYGDFMMYDSEGVDRSADVLCREGRVALLCVNDAEAVERCGRGLARLRTAYPDEAIVILTAAGDVDLLAGLTTYAVDAMMLRTMMRADVGVVILNDGVIEFKSNVRDIM